MFSSLSQRLQRGKDELSAYLNRNHVQSAGLQSNFRRSLPVESPLESYGKKGRDLLLSAQNLVSFISPTSKEGYSSKNEVSSSDLILRIENLETRNARLEAEIQEKNKLLHEQRLDIYRRREEEEDVREDLLKRCRVAEALRDEALDSFDEAISQLKFLERKFKDEALRADEELQRVQEESDNLLSSKQLAMEAMKSTLQREIEELKSKCAEHSLTIQKLQDESKKEEYEKLQKLSEDQAKQIESLRTELKKADNFYLSRAKFDARLREEAKKANEEKEALQSMVDSLKARENEQHGIMKKQIEYILDRVQGSLLDCIAVQDCDGKGLELVEMLRSENSKLTADLSALTDQLEGERRGLQGEASKNISMKREIEALRSDQSKLVLEKEAMSNKISSLEVEFNELRSNFSEVKYLADQRRKILESTLERLSMKATAEDKEEKARKEWEAEHNKLQAHLAIVALPPVGPCIHAKGGAAGGATDIAIEHEPELPEIVPFKVCDVVMVPV
uniref:Uncharacterized protein n=1 Tax=Guillardia theta TaxID=55529 RepID=A0A6U5Z6A5_GUITH